MNFPVLIAELEKIGKMYKKRVERKKAFNLLFNDVGQDFLSFSFEEVEQIRKTMHNIVHTDDLRGLVVDRSKIRTNDDPNVWLPHLLMGFVIEDGTGDFRDDFLIIVSFIEALPLDFDRQPYFERAAMLSRGDANDIRTMRGVLASRAIPGPLAWLLGIIIRKLKSKNFR